MRISTALIFDRASTVMSKLDEKAQTLQTQVSTGLKSNAPSDDVVAYQRLATIRRQAADDKVTSGNIGLAQTLLKQSDSALSAVQADLQHASELAIQANTGTLSNADRKAIGTQMRAVLDDIVMLANSTDPRGQPLYAAQTGDTAVTQASNGAVSFTGTGDPATLPIGGGAAIQATDSAARVFGGVRTRNGATTDVFAILSTLAAALQTGNDPTGAVASGGDDLRSALDQVSAAASSVGARVARLDLESQRMQEVAVDREADRSSLEDTDMTAAITELQKTMTILSATQASFTKLSRLSLFDYFN